ncbi:MAG: hypothetical protein IPK57_09995 [Chitinophagaceae bacterium]|nr:hypothetical protein [Chitinophagaceae bacterium]
MDYLGLKPTPTDRTIRGIAGIRNVSFLYDRQLHFPGLTIDNLNFHINDYEILTAVYGGTSLMASLVILSSAVIS